MRSTTIRATVLSFASAVLFFTAGSTLQAAQINGNIAFAGTVSLDTSSAATATEVTAWHFAGNVGNPYVADASGDFTPTIGMSVTFAAPWFFDMPAGPPIVSFWSVGAFTFDLQMSVIVSQGIDPNGNGFVIATGTGIFHGVGFDNTPGTWSFNTQDPPAGGVFSFSASGAVIPEPSTTALIAVGALLAGAAFRVLSSKARVAR